MICPILTLINANRPERVTGQTDGVNCNDGCAWWDTKKGQCCIKTLAQTSYSLKETIQNHLIKR